MAKHDNKIAEKFQDSVKDLDSMSEQDLLDRMNETIKAVEVDDSYNTNDKLKIYSLITSLSNSEGNDRKKFANKIFKALR
jgi:hypothetical protein